MKLPHCILAAVLVVLCAANAPAAMAPAEARKAAAQVDALLAAHWKASGVAANAPASDEVFVRRVYLNLAGRIPTGEEAAAFLASTDKEKRGALIESLLGRESYVQHFFNLWADVLRYKSSFINRANVVEAAYGFYLQESLRSNKPFDQFAREMLSAKGYAWDNGAVGYYHRDPDMPLDNMAITARIFLGTRIECAQCHDHPFDTWKQTDFYHLAAYTHSNRELNEAFDGQRAAMQVREKAIEELCQKERKTATDGGKAAEAHKQDRLAALDNRGIAGVVKGPVGQLFSPVGLKRNPASVLKLPRNFSELDGNPLDPMAPKPIFGPAAEVAPGQDPAEVFANWTVSPENPRFTRLIVNRLWKSMFGAGLTEPIDDLREQNAAMVPEVEAHLVGLMVALKYDMKAFLAVLANTRAYQAEAIREEFTPGSVCHFQGPLLRRMTAEQVWDSLVALASHEPDARNTARMEAEQRRVAVSQMALESYVNFDGEALLDLAVGRLGAERELSRREKAVREAMVVAKREGDQAKVKELAHEEGGLSRERGQALVDGFIMPMLNNLAKRKGGEGAVPVMDPLYKINANPRVLAVETWRRMYVPGYGPAPKTPAQLEAEAKAEEQRISACATRLGIPKEEQGAFRAYWQRGRPEWLRAAELESPAPRGHFLRTMGQSDRDFVENANPNAAIPQALLLMNSDLISEQGLLSRYSPLMQFVNRARTPAEKVDAAYLALLSRKPTTEERAALEKSQSRGLGSLEDVIYALLNTRQFLFIQ